MIHYTLLRTVLDPLLAVAGPAGLVRLEFLPRAWEYHTRAHAVARQNFAAPALAAADGNGDETVPPPPLVVTEDASCFAELRDQLAEYFTGQREVFDIELDLRGSDFQMKVLRQLQRIPFGKLRTYGQLARTMRQPKATRAVGQAAGHNPLPILIPCHRLVGKGGSLVGFAGGITTKARLLRLEGHTLGDAARIEEPKLF
ncbi:MAG: methylated-DNA--[protein]-cysteine S-methyltransferase [bacterium]|nr:methylated-DNA--[protein]-cysteine S-methyltransferase [bacterium]